MRAGMTNAGSLRDWASATRPDHSQADFKEREKLQFWFIYLACFLVFLLAAIVGRLTPWAWRRGYQRKSIFGEAKAAANTVLPYVFVA